MKIVTKLRTLPLRDPYFWPLFDPDLTIEIPLRPARDGEKRDGEVCRVVNVVVYGPPPDPRGTP